MDDNNNDAVVEHATRSYEAIVAHHRETGCTRKIAYISAGVAAQAAQEYMAHNPTIEVMGAYKCWFCPDWHITTKPKGLNSATYVEVQRDPNIKNRLQIERDRLRRRLRVKIEREEQARLRLLG